MPPRYFMRIIKLIRVAMSLGFIAFGFVLLERLMAGDKSLWSWIECIFCIVLVVCWIGSLLDDLLRWQEYTI